MRIFAFTLAFLLATTAYGQETCLAEVEALRAEAEADLAAAVEADDAANVALRLANREARQADRALTRAEDSVQDANTAATEAQDEVAEAALDVSALITDERSARVLQNRIERATMQLAGANERLAEQNALIAELTNDITRGEAQVPRLQAQLDRQQREEASQREGTLTPARMALNQAMRTGTTEEVAAAQAAFDAAVQAIEDINTEIRRLKVAMRENDRDLENDADALVIAEERAEMAASFVSVYSVDLSSAEGDCAVVLSEAEEQLAPPEAEE